MRTKIVTELIDQHGETSELPPKQSAKSDTTNSAPPTHTSPSGRNGDDNLRTRTIGPRLNSPARVSRFRMGHAECRYCEVRLIGVMGSCWRIVYNVRTRDLFCGSGLLSFSWNPAAWVMYSDGDDS